MTEYSWFWDGTVTGDAAALAPYSNDEFTDVWGAISTFDRTSSRLIVANQSYGGVDYYFGTFTVTVNAQTPYGGVVTIGPGVAIVDGKVYRLLGNKQFAMRNEGTYRIYLKKTFPDNPITPEEGQNVRLIMEEITPSGLVLNNRLTRVDGEEWGVPLITATVNGSGVLAVNQYAMPTGSEENSLTKWFNTNPVVAGRVGGSATAWATGGVVNYVTPMSRIEFGVTALAAASSTTSFCTVYSNTPLVIIQPLDTAGDWSLGNNYWLSAISVANFTVTFDNITNLNAYMWFAIGPS